ncbi:MAG: PocR ligand-binding domain-containing protein [Lachnospiraceae bacterium]|nr:PocR ligand-binding domain-containing protein [Lachnospiraceae bacterium]
MKLSDFMDITHLQTIQDAFSDATGLAAVAIDTDGNYITKGSGFTDFCMKYTRGCAEGARRCQRCDAEGKGVYECHAGLMDFSIDIILNGEKLGAVIGGQVLPQEPDEEKFTTIAKELGIDPSSYIRAVHKVPVRSEKAIRSAAELLKDVVNRMVLQEYMNATEYKKIHVWQDEIVKATDAVLRIKENTKELESLASKQTIMALNASIETARVGAAGAGFGVIAKQMGVFSKQSTVIYKKITEDANSISESIEKMNET